MGRSVTCGIPVPRPFAQATGRPHRQLRLPDLDEERLVALHLGRREEAHRNGVDLREVPRNYRGERKRHGRQALTYASWGYRPPSPEAVFTTYRLRFGIESSYRPMHEGRIRTTTRRPVVRLLSVGIALVLRNLWVWLPYTILAMPRRGGRVILLERRRWETLLLWLLHVVEEALGVADVT